MSNMLAKYQYFLAINPRLFDHEFSRTACNQISHQVLEQIGLDLHDLLCSQENWYE